MHPFKPIPPLPSATADAPRRSARLTHAAAVAVGLLLGALGMYAYAGSVAATPRVSADGNVFGAGRFQLQQLHRQQQMQQQQQQFPAAPQPVLADGLHGVSRCSGQCRTYCLTVGGSLSYCNKKCGC